MNTQFPPLANVPDLTGGLCIGHPDPDSYWFATRPDASTPEGLTLLHSWKARRDEAKNICGQCPVRAKCERENRFEPFGIFGGTTPADRGFDNLGRRKDRVVTPPDWPSRARAIELSFARTDASIEVLAQRFGVTVELAAEAVGIETDSAA